MNKDNICDYTISMFRYYARMSEPDESTIEQLRAEISPADILDLQAVSNTLNILEKQQDYEAIAAVRAIYFTAAQRRLRKSEISQRVIKYTLENYISERVVWKRLNKARRIAAEQRQLRID